MDDQNDKPIGFFEPIIEQVKSTAQFFGWKPSRKFNREIIKDKNGKVVSDTPMRVEPQIKNYKWNFKFDRRGLMARTADGKMDEFANNNIGKEGAMLLRAKGSVGGVVIGDDPFQLQRPGGSKRIPANKAMIAYTGWPYAAISSIAMDMATIEWRLFQVHSNDDHEEIFEHELLDLLEGVNEFQTGTELRFIMAAHLELAGNCYLLKLDKNGKPVVSDTEAPAKLYPLNPGGVTMVFDKTSFPYVLLKYIFTFDGQKHAYDPVSILHIKYPDPTDMWSGIGPTQAIAGWIDVDNYTTEYKRRFFINGAHIDGMLESDMTAEETIDVLRTSWENAHQGLENAHKTPVLPKGVKYVTTSASPKDNQIVDIENASRDRILAGFKVSKTILGTAESDTNRATAETADYVFAKRTIAPKMKLICAYLNQFLAPLFGDDIYISFENPVPEDAEFRTKEMQAVMGNAPVMSANEAREEYQGLGPVEGGDEVMTMTTLAPLGDPRERSTGGGGGNDEPKEPKEDDDDEGEDENDDDEGEDASKSKRAGRHGGKVRRLPRNVVRMHLGGLKTRGSQNMKVKNDLKAALSSRVKESLEAAAAEASKRSDITKLTHEEYNAIYKEFLTRVDPYEKKINDLLVQINKSQEKEVLENLAKIPGVKKAVDPSQIFDLKKWIDITIQALEPVLRELGNQEGAAAASLVNVPLPAEVFDNPEAQAALDNSVALMANSYNETVLAALRDTLDKGVREGLGYEPLAEKVSDIYAFQDEVAAMRVARTESVRISNFATKQAWKQEGTVRTIKWYTAPDSNVCGYCQEMDGKVIGIDDVFFKEGEMIPATEASGMPDVVADYGDVGAPPLHPNCRCYIRPDQLGEPGS